VISASSRSNGIVAGATAATAVNRSLLQIVGKLHRSSRSGETVAPANDHDPPMTRRLATALVLIAVFAACSSDSEEKAAPNPTVAAPTTTTEPARRQVVPARTRFTVDGRAVDLICRGRGRIPVVFLAGGRSPGLVWNGLIDSLGDNVFTCVFNRPGTTDEEITTPPTELTTPRGVAAALADTLEQANIGPRVVLVGHSVAGDSALVFGADHPERVAGAVLFDPTVPNLVPAEGWESIGFDAAPTVQQTRAVTRWPDVPLVVLTADSELVVKNHEATAAEEREWIAGHKRYAELSEDGSQREVPGSSHDIYLSAPEVAATTVREVLRAAEQ
jgi:pimeloyl-ACP methyl ester carboxylesterase